jgi:hypothetical protein
VRLQTKVNIDDDGKAQISFSMETIDYWVSVMIAKFLSPMELLSLSLVNTHFKLVVDTPQLWENVFQIVQSLRMEQTFLRHKTQQLLHQVGSYQLRTQMISIISKHVASLKANVKKPDILTACFSCTFINHISYESKGAQKCGMCSALITDEFNKIKAVTPVEQLGRPTRIQYAIALREIRKLVKREKGNIYGRQYEVSRRAQRITDSDEYCFYAMGCFVFWMLIFCILLNLYLDDMLETSPLGLMSAPLGFMIFMCCFSSCYTIWTCFDQRSKMVLFPRNWSANGILGLLSTCLGSSYGIFAVFWFASVEDTYVHAMLPLILLAPIAMGIWCMMFLVRYCDRYRTYKAVESNAYKFSSADTEECTFVTFAVLFLGSILTVFLYLWAALLDGEIGSWHIVFIPFYVLLGAPCLLACFIACTEDAWALPIVFCVTSPLLTWLILLAYNMDDHFTSFGWVFLPVYLFLPCACLAVGVIVSCDD